MDCYYCHYTANKSAYAAVPATQVCMKLPRPVNPRARGSRKYAKLGNGHADRMGSRPPNVPEFAFFNHQAHVTVGVRFVASCHGRMIK